MLHQQQGLLKVRRVWVGVSGAARVGRRVNGWMVFCAVGVVGVRPAAAAGQGLVQVCWGASCVRVKAGCLIPAVSCA